MVLPADPLLVINVGRVPGNNPVWPESRVPPGGPGRRAELLRIIQNGPVARTNGIAPPPANGSKTFGASPSAPGCRNLWAAAINLRAGSMNSGLLEFSHFTRCLMNSRQRLRGVSSNRLSLLFPYAASVV